MTGAKPDMIGKQNSFWASGNFLCSNCVPMVMAIIVTAIGNVFISYNNNNCDPGTAVAAAEWSLGTQKFGNCCYRAVAAASIGVFSTESLYS